jgi:hypothetical protein
MIVRKQVSKYNPDYAQVMVKSTGDSVSLADALQALSQFKDQEFLNKAFEQDNVVIYIRPYYRYVPVGNVSKSMYTNFLTVKQ